MRKFNTAGLDEALMRTLSADEASWIYNGLDCCVTFEIFERLQEELAASPENVRYTYEMALAKQAPILEMSMRGILVDEAARKKSVALLQRDLDALNARFQRIMREVFGHELNWDSPLQLKNLFYGTLRIKEIKKRNAQGQYVATVDEKALNKLCTNFFARPLARYVLAMREIRKKLSFLKTQIDPDGRMRATLNIAGTNTGRLSSAMNDFGTGSNLQNVDTALRFPFISDARKVLVNVDLEQADARNVGAIIWNTFLETHGPEEAGRYLDACESGDLHTFVCRMAWSDLPWPEDRSGWRSIADQTAYREFSYRDLAKRLGHGTNYYGQPRTMASHTQTETRIIEQFQRRYFAAFPLIQQWHHHVIEQIKTTGCLTTPYGRRRFFFGRGDDQATWRKAIAFAPQSMTGHQIDMGLLRLWREMPEAELLMQVHDSVLFQVPWKGHEALIERALALLEYRKTLAGGREFFVPLEAQVGWNWGKAEIWSKEDAAKGKCNEGAVGTSKRNPYGLIKWKGADNRQPPATQRLADYL